VDASEWHDDELFRPPTEGVVVGFALGGVVPSFLQAGLGAISAASGPIMHCVTMASQDDCLVSLSAPVKK
jgi:hypothetical protein